ncbi:MAG: hypothetical protein RIC35_10755 [Marinoscillum sp.]
MIKILFTAASLWFIMAHIQQSSFPLGSLTLTSQNLWWIMIAVILMPINWWLEIVKWRISVPAENLTFNEARTAVLSGLALNWVLPFTLGDLSGRLAAVNHYRATAKALLVTRMLSLGITLVFGGFAVLHFFSLPQMSYLLVIIGFIFLTFLMYRVYGSKEHVRFIKILTLTAIRYLVFTAQFTVLIYAIIPSLSFSVLILGIGWVFLFRSVIPSLFGNFGIREASALVFFESYLETPAMILLPCLLIWMINTIIPSIVGATYIFKLKVNIAR